MTPEQLQDLFFNKPYSRLLLLFVVGVVVVGGILIGNRLNTDRNDVKKVDAWRTKYSYLLTNLTKDFQKAETDATTNNDAGPQLATDCKNIKADAQDAQSKPPIPDPAIQPNWAKAMRYEVQAATECEDGLNAGDSNKEKLATTDFNNATTSLQTTSKQMQAIQAQ